MTLLSPSRGLKRPLEQRTNAEEQTKARNMPEGHAEPGGLRMECKKARVQAGQASLQTASSKSHSNIQVAVRVRSSADVASGEVVSSSCLEVLASKNLIHRQADKAQQFTFDHVLDGQASQQFVFEVCGKPLVEHCLAGFNGTLLAYGQTGSGKTHTVLGADASACNPEDEGRGLIPRMAEHLFARLHEEQAAGRIKQCKTHFSCLEIHNECITDLLSSPSSQVSSSLRLLGSKEIVVEGLREDKVTCVEDVLMLLKRSTAQRHVAETNMNKRSSRSHAVFSLRLDCRLLDEAGVPCRRSCLLRLVDLAGSESAKRSGAEGERLKEAGQINKSLLTLGNVITQLVDSQQRGSEAGLHVAFRDSKLTHLLRDSLGGNSQTCLVAALSPAAADTKETLSTLQFADKAKRVRNTAVKNEQALLKMAAHQQEIRRLQAELAAKADFEAQLHDQQAQMEAERQMAGEQQQQIESLQAQLASSEEQRSVLSKELEAVRQQVASHVEAEQEQHHAGQQKLESEVAALKQQLAAQAAALQAQQDKVQQLATARAAAVVQLADSSRDVECFRSSRDALQQELGAARAEVKQLRLQAVQDCNRGSSLEAQLHSLGQRLADCQAQAERSQQAAAEAQQQVAAAETRAQQLESEAAGLQHKVAAVEAEAQQKTAAVREAREQLAVAQAELQALRQQHLDAGPPPAQVRGHRISQVDVLDQPWGTDEAGGQGGTEPDLAVGQVSQTQPQAPAAGADATRAAVAAATRPAAAAAATEKKRRRLQPQPPTLALRSVVYGGKKQAKPLPAPEDFNFNAAAISHTRQASAQRLADANPGWLGGQALRNT